MSRTDQQQRAIDLRDADVFLRAGAGTGKTGVLVDRYCAAVADDEVAPEQILAFTFTERAAGELRRRVRAELVRRAAEAKAESDEDLALRLEEAVRGLGAAPITTIHGFCRRLLAAHPVAAGLDPRFRVLDASEARRIAWAAFDAALEDLISAGNDTDERVLAVYGVQRARGIVLAAHEELRSRGDSPRLPAVSPRDLGAALQRLNAAAAATDGARGGKAEENACFARARALTEAAAEGTPTLAELEALEIESSTKVEERRACHDAIAEAIAVASEPTAGLEAHGVLGRLLERFSARYTEGKVERSGLDFEDLQLRAVSLLRDSAGIGLSYRERFKHLLVDEFQDTNALQLALVEQLRGPDSHLFVVGDRFQAIYGFRHADIDVFNREEDRFRERRGAEVLSLTGNFRSRPEIIAAANALGAATMPGFAELSAGRTQNAGGGGTVEVLVTETGKWGDEDMCLERRTGDGMPPECVAEARNVAQRLRAIADDGADPGDMVVLLRAFTHVDAFEEALDRVGLAPYVAGGGGYWSQQQTQDLISLLSAVANPLADEQLLGVLASPACGVSPDTLWLLRRGIGRKRSIWLAVLAAVGAENLELEDAAAIEAISPAERERLAALHAVLASLRSLGPRLPLEALVERAITGSGYDLGVLGADHGPARFANVTKLMRLAREYERVEGRDLRGFLDFAALAAAQDDEPPAAVEAEEGEGVKIMTIHSAKGLEFPVVAVAELGRETVRGSRAGDLILGRADEDPVRVGLRLARIGRSPLDLFHHSELSEEAISRDEAEELRLSYVALTRARERLILSGIRKTTKHGDPRSKSVLRRLLEHCGQEAPENGAALQLPGAPGIDGTTGEAVEIPVSVSVPSAEEGERLSQRRTPPPAPEPAGGRPPLVRALAPPAPVRALSYSTLHEHARCGYRFYVERVVGLGESGRGGGDEEGAPQRDHALHLGNAVHELLRWSAEHRWSAPGSAIVAGALARQGLGGPSDTQRASRLVSAWLESDLGREIASGPASLQPEHPFLVELAGATVRGTIDLLVRRPGRPPLLVDYKTNRLNARSAAEAAEDYEIQRRLYALAAARGLGADRIHVAYAFLEAPDDPVVTELGPGELAEAAAILEGRITEIAEGSFEVTPNPTWPLCHDCPARSRLCPAPAKPQRDEAQRVAV